MLSVVTSRLALVPATATHLQAEVVGRAALGAALNADVPPSWPPELYDEDAVRYFLSRVLEHPEQPGWGSHYVVRRPTALEMPLLIGTGGFKGAPDDAGSIEVGYSVLPEQQRRGYATEALRGWVEWAFASPSVQTIVAHTLPHLTASIRVLEKAGFCYAGKGNDPHALAEERVIRYELSRDTFVSRVATGSAT